MLRLNYAAASDRGLVRGNNEDSAYAGPHLIALADGMGGHAAGEVASQLMINHLMRLDADADASDMLALLASVADDANRAIAQGVRDVPETDGMGTTLTALMFNGADLAMCHVGDSRGYRLRDGALEQITVDDTYVQSLVDKGQLAPEDVSTHPQRSMILKAYAGRPVEPTLKMIDIRPGDRFLLCSDGLSDPVTHSTIETTLQHGTPQEAARQLVDLALRSGGPDNVTVVVADVVEADDPDESAAAASLPVTPLTVGALNSCMPEDPRPDTAAGRAAMAIAQRQPQVILPDSEPAKEATPSPRRRMVSVISALVVLAVLISAGWWGSSMVKNNYYVTTADSDSTQGALVIENGIDVSLLGTSLHSTYQFACLNPEGDLTFVDSADAENSCHRFRLSDLKESARGQVSTLPDGSYDEVQQQLQRLAEQTLPACITRQAAQPKDKDNKKPAAPSSAAPTTTKAASPSSTGSPDDLSTPGETCREVK